jgi:murein DD-endopeptidase MepM/ murein hydrolase activator NlpD
MISRDNSSARCASSTGKKSAFAILLIILLFSLSVAEASMVSDSPSLMALDVAAALPKNSRNIGYHSDIEEATISAISSVKGIVSLMRQAQEVSAALPGRQHKVPPAPKSGIDIALGVAARLPDLPQPAPAVVKKPAAPAAAKPPALTASRKPEQSARPPAAIKRNAELPSKQGLIWPVDGLIYSAFNATRGRRLHGAIDIVTEKGSPIAAAADGIVSVAANGGKNFSGYGKIVILDHGKGLYTVYAHCDTLLVKMGQRVKQGEYIATVGRTGRASTDHCHFEVRIAGKKYDPLAYLPSRPEMVKATNYHSPRKRK